MDITQALFSFIAFDNGQLHFFRFTSLNATELRMLWITSTMDKRLSTPISYIHLIQTQCYNFLYPLDPEFVTTVSADIYALSGARSSAVTMLDTK